MKRRGNMLCFFHKWNISRALDTEKPLSRLTKRHLAGCETCREFLRTGDRLAHRLTEDAASLLREARPGLGEKARQAAGGFGMAGFPSRSRVRRTQLGPLLAAGVLLAVVAVSLIWMVRSRPAEMPPLDSLLKLDGPRAYLESALQRAQTPYNIEFRELKKTFQSTADYLAARFDTSLGERN